MGGSDDASNIVSLTPREHFIAHWLLWRIHRNREMSTSFMLMSRNCTSSRAYAEARESMRLTIISPETRKRMSSVAKNRTGSLNGFFGKKHSQETITRWISIRKGKESPKKKKIEQIDLETGIVLKKFDSLREASSFTGVSVSSVCFSCQNPSKKPRKKRNFTFRYS